MHAVVEIGEHEVVCVIGNRAAAEFLDRTPEQLVGRPLTALGIPASQVEDLRRQCRLQSETLGAGRFESELDLPGRGPRRLRTTVRHIGPGASGPQFAVNSEDVTESTTAAFSLRRAEQSFATLVRNLAGAVYRCRNDEEWTLEFISQGCLPITGYQPNDLIGNRIASLGSLVHRDDAARVRASCQASLAERRDCSNEYRIVHRDGSVRWVWDRAQGIYDDAGTLLHIEGLLIDITDRLKETEERNQLNEQLLHAQRVASIGRLAGGVAHDFNNLVAVVLGHADLLGSQVPAHSPLHEHITEIRSAAERSVHLTRQLLGFARRQPIAPTVLDLNSSVDAALSMLRRLIGESIEVGWVPGSEIWPVRMDPTQLDQILTNLCVNARDAMETGGALLLGTANVELDASFAATHAGAVIGEYVRLQVVDSGTGMDDHTLAHIFDPFFTTKEVGRGTGLGMATVYGIVKQNRGYIDVISAPDAGTTINVYLPRHVAVVEPEVDVAVGSNAPRGTESILLVEDDLALLRTGELVLTSLGYTVVATHSPVEAAVMGTTGGLHFDLLVTDIVMPGLTGRILADHLIAELPGIAVLYMSGYTSMENAPPGGSRHFIAKPFTPAELARKVRDVLDARVLSTKRPPVRSR